MATKKAAKKSTKKSSVEENMRRSRCPTRKYSPSAGKDVEREIKAMKQGKLKSGRSGKTVNGRKQAIYWIVRGAEGREEGSPAP